MVSIEDKTTITASKDTREWLMMLKLEIQAAKNTELSQDDIVRLALACLERHKQEVEKTWTSQGTVKTAHSHARLASPGH